MPLKETRLIRNACPQDNAAGGLYAGAMKYLVLIALAAWLPAGQAVAQSKASARPQPDRPAKSVSAKPLSEKAARTCSEYGAGFVRVEGTGACVKIGGYMRIEGAR